MADQTRTRERSLEAAASETRLYEPKIYDYAIDELERAAKGRIVVKATDRLWDMHRQANSKRYLSPLEPELSDTATHYWEVFLQIFPERSGKHRHQGGLVIFVLEGNGHSVYDGHRHDWEAGDLMLLPMTPGGIEHQHFNHDPDKPAKWIAFMYWPYFDYGGSEITQLETSPLYDAWLKRMEEKEGQFDAPKRGKR